MIKLNLFSNNIFNRGADSMGRIPSGIFDGTTFDFGEYEQCLLSEMPVTPTSDLIIRGLNTI